MGNQAGGRARFKGAGSLWKTSWKGRSAFSEFCCFQGFARGEGGRYYTEPGGALDIVPAVGTWLNFIVDFGAPLALGTSEFIARNGTDPEGWELIANQGMAVDGEGVSFTFRVYDGAGVTASVTTTTIFSLALLDGILDSIGFRISAFFLPPSGPAPNGQIAIAVEGLLTTPFASLLAPYVNTTPALLLGIGTGALTEDFGPPQSICGLAGGEGDFTALESAAHTAWIAQVAAESQMVVMPGVVSGNAVPGYTVEDGWRGNNPYLSSGDAPDPLAPFVGADSLVEAGGTGTLTVECGTVIFSAETT
jgi:hypothetical protein